MASPETGPPPGDPAATPPAGPASSAPIRIILKKEEPPAPPPPDEAPEGGVSPQTGLLLGVVVLLALLVAAKAAVVFFGLSCAMALLHREIKNPGQPLGEYARLIPERVEALFQRLGNPDGRVVLSILLLAGAVIMAHKIVFGLAGAAALITALYLLDFLDRPAAQALDWFNSREEQWAREMKAFLGQPIPSHLLSILALLPPAYYLAALVPIPPAIPHFPGRLGVAAVIALVPVAWMVASLGFGAKPAGAEDRRLDGRTLLLSMLGLSLCCLGMGLAAAWQIRIGFLTRRLEWNGAGLAAFPVIVIWWWYRRYRLRPLAGQSAENATWRFSGLVSLTAAITCYLCWRGLALESVEWGQPASLAVFVLALAACFILLRLAVGLVRESPGRPVPEWAVFQMAFVLSLLVFFFLVHLGGIWGLALAVFPVIKIWRELAGTSQTKPEGGGPTARSSG